jgi:cytochrome c5
MKKNKSLKVLVQSTFAVVAATAMLGGLASTTLFSAETNSVAVLPKTDPAPAATNSVAVTAQAPAVERPVLKHQLTGAELYSMHCNRCHPERYPTERTGAQWKTIMLHMQVRANIPNNQAKLILQYLQDNSGR